MASSEEDRLVHAAKHGDQDAVAAIFEYHRSRLERMVQVRLDPRLRGRIDTADVMQDAFLDVQRRFAEFAQYDGMPVFLWLRMVTGQRLVDLHRHHIGAKMRDATREVSSMRQPLPAASSIAIAHYLADSVTSVSSAAIREETRKQIEGVLDELAPSDREVLVLRHFEFLSNAEVAAELGIGSTAASNRYIRAVKRFKEALEAAGLGRSEWK